MIRRATPDDGPQVLELIREFYEIDGHDFDLETVNRALLPLLETDQHGIVLVADGAYAVLVWSYSLESGGRDAMIDEIYVRDRGNGTGAALIGQLLDETRARGLSRVFLETEPGNHRARSFYERHGFEAEDSGWMALELGSPL